ncbi:MULTISPECIES: LysR family transcriptional regulator [Marinobacter]|uniref:LysR family transcriptional regulator n=1 Tax=Marinobacter TaxID=2742 RepID=UPI0012469F77|nr:MULTISPECIES: LysR family transcriptional regulator [Marinobacter]MBJ7275784.1 LysR family transcriptional regulator [Marinobacter salarius]MBL3559004.1 LysR family transcriptional regulator [Marinobacter sp. JB05H06]
MHNTFGMQVFVYVVEKGSFSAVAKELELTPSAVSKQISRLETELGTRLMNRSTHDLCLTEAGKVYYGHCLQIIREMDLASEAIHEMNTTLSGTLKLHVTPGIGRQIVLPALTEFIKKYNNLSVKLSVQPARVDVINRGFDLSIRSSNSDYVKLSTTSVDCVMLAPLTYRVCASPEYFRRFGRPKKPMELSQHQCLIYDAQPSPEKWWFINNGEWYHVNVGGRFHANEWSSINSAAVEGIGIARLLMQNSNSPDPSLETLFEDETLSDRAVWAFHPRARSMPKKVKKFIDFMTKRLRE